MMHPATMMMKKHHTKNVFLMASGIIDFIVKLNATSIKAMKFREVDSGHTHVIIIIYFETERMLRGVIDGENCLDYGSFSLLKKIIR